MTYSEFRAWAAKHGVPIHEGFCPRTHPPRVDYKRLVGAGRKNAQRHRALRGAVAHLPSRTIRSLKRDPALRWDPVMRSFTWAVPEGCGLEPDDRGPRKFTLPASPTGRR